MNENRLAKFIMVAALFSLIAIIFKWMTVDEFISAWAIGIPALLVGAFFFGRKKE